MEIAAGVFITVHGINVKECSEGLKPRSHYGIQKSEEDCAQPEQACDSRMERSKKSAACFVRGAVRFAGDTLDATLQEIQRLIIDGRSGRKIHYAAHVVRVGRTYGFRPAQREFALSGAQRAPGGESAPIASRAA